jgi:homoserine O-acetyltransferase
MTSDIYTYKNEFLLESGGSLPGIQIAYTTHGKINQDQSNVIWVFHALTANQNPFEWWPGLFGDDYLFNAQEHFIVCANVLGGCNGSTGPISIENENLKNGQFPQLTIRDIVKGHELLQQYLGITKIKVAIGGSFGGYQALEMAYNNSSIENLIIIAAGAIETPWNIAIHETQRLAMEADGNFSNEADNFNKGLIAARGIGLLTYRTSATFVKTQARLTNQLGDFAVASYIRYQGEKLEKRFSPWTYYKLTQTLDTHDLGRNRGGIEVALNSISAKTLAIGISEDLLTKATEVEKIVASVPNAAYREISSPYGHDGFLLETKQLTQIIKQFLN